jgi:hypothetical protein
MISSQSYRSMAVLSRSFAVVALASGLALGAGAQTGGQNAIGDGVAVASSVDRLLDLATVAGVSYSSTSSSSDGAQLVDGSSFLEFAGAGMQPPPRRSYGRPRYNDRSHNSDGSSKWTGDGAVGFTLPIGDTFHYYNTGWALQVGFGRRFSKKFAVPVQFDYDHFGVNGLVLQNQLALYDEGCASSCLTSVDGNNHIWSFTLNPTYTLAEGDKVGAYVVGGVGYYHKVTNFTTPETGEECYYYCYTVEENAVIDHYTSNAPGFNGGFGLTYKFSRFADERFFVEARYVYVLNSQRYGYVYANNANGYTTTGTNPDPNNLFPANSNRTSYIPIKFGIRF